MVGILSEGRGRQPTKQVAYRKTRYTARDKINDTSRPLFFLFLTLRTRPRPSNSIMYRAPKAIKPLFFVREFSSERFDCYFYEGSYAHTARFMQELLTSYYFTASEKYWGL